ncbi:MAG TPA: acylphosphatase [Usitatibacter sp.]|nr:acylphosphatase [Usitatibacter sp.]
MSEALTRRLRVHGRVQGVFFRESMRLEAERLGIAGWVCNRRDGTVEAVVHGTPQAVERITEWARRGPADADVTSVDVSPAEGAFERFEKRPTF